MTSNVCAVVFDYDGTLGATFESNRHVTRAICRHLGHPPKEQLEDKQNYLDLVSRVDHFTEIYEDLGLSKEEILRAQDGLWDHYHQELSMPVTLYEGIPELVRTLELPMAVHSLNTSGTIRTVLKHHGISEYFPVIVGSDNCAYHKPHPQGLIRCADELAVEGPIVFVGDHRNDFRTAYNANLTGLQVFAVGAGFEGDFIWDPEPNWKVRSPLEIIEVIDNIDASDYQLNEVGKLVPANP